MSTPTIRDLCAALSGDVAYLVDCIRDGGPDPVTLQEIAGRANTARDLLAAEPVGEGPNERDVAEWINGLPVWHGATRDELPGIVLRAFARWGRPAAAPVPRPEGDWFAVAMIAQDMRSRGLADQACGDELLKLANSNRSRLARPAAPPVPEPPAVALAARTVAAMEICHGHKDGECHWEQCPQLRDSEPATTGRSCPLLLDPDDIERAALDRFHRPAAPAAPEPGEGGDQERLRIMAAGIRYGYMAGHNDTVEACYGDPDAVAADYAPEILGELGIAPPAPESPAEALAARSLLEQMARLQHSQHSNPWGQLLTLSSRAAAWLRENPPGQPVAIEPSDCPIPGACSCVEPAQPAPEVVPPGLIVRFEFEVLDQYDQAVASGDAPTLEEAAREGRHYLGQYEKDGPCTLELRRVEVLNPHAIPLPQGREGEG